jgi:hypothetical protein
MAFADAPGSLPTEVTAGRDRPRWWTQVLLIAAVWWTYDAINNLNPLKATTALGHGTSILGLETTLHVAAERWLNAWLGGHLALGRWVGDYYDVAHFAVTIGVLIWVWWRHPGRYRPLRNALLGINVIGFVVYWAYPVAPPRLLSGSGFVDIVAVTHSIGAWSSGALASQANDYAAMPSLHVAWALWCTLAVWSIRKDRPARAGAAAYSILTSIAVMATANHYMLDVVAGAAAAAIAAAPMLLAVRRARRSPQSDGPLADEEPPGAPADGRRPRRVGVAGRSRSTSRRRTPAPAPTPGGSGR